MFSICSSVISNKPALSSIRSFSLTFSFDRCWVFKCELISSSQLFRATKSLHPRLLPHFHPIIPENEHRAAILQGKIKRHNCENLFLLFSRRTADVVSATNLREFNLARVKR